MNTNINKNSVFLIKNTNKIKIDFGFSNKYLLLGPVQLFKDKHYKLGLIIFFVYILSIFVLIIDFDSFLLVLFVIAHILLAFSSFRIIIIYSIVFEGYKPFSKEDISIMKKDKFFKRWKILN